MKTLTLIGLLLISGVAFGQTTIKGTVWVSDIEPMHTLVFKQRPDTVIFTADAKVMLRYERGKGNTWLIWYYSPYQYNFDVKFTAVFK